ncbi:efflux RND transporter periplasmic adaptor subunit [Methylomonas sp. MgM2]
MQLLRFVCFAAILFSTDNRAAVYEDEDTHSSSPKASSAAAKSTDSNTPPSAGIVTERLLEATHQPEFSAYGTVLGLEPLLALRQQYLAAQAQRDSAEAKFHEADLNLNRIRNLHRHDIASTRQLQEQQALWRNYKANLATSTSQQQTILATSRLQWGDTLTGWFTANHNRHADQFLNSQAQLLQITLPANVVLASAVDSINVDERGRRDKAITASLISPAPQVDPVTQGQRYFFKIEDRKLPFGTHISVWIAGEKHAENSGVLIPENAVVWHLGQAFVFIKTEKGDFQRHLLPQLIPSQGGYFASGGFKPGEEIVTVGAQTLLSEELKNLIPREDDD